MLDNEKKWRDNWDSFSWEKDPIILGQVCPIQSFRRDLNNVNDAGFPEDTIHTSAINFQTF